MTLFYSFIIFCFTLSTTFSIQNQLRRSFLGVKNEVKEPTCPIVSRTAFDAVKQNPKKLSSVFVVGNTSMIKTDHPTIRLIMQRFRQDSKPNQRRENDTEKIALCIEGGGMRGCVPAGAVAALNFLGLEDTIDVIYGSSAGAMIGAYFVSRQSSGMKIYYDTLPSVGKLFIDKFKLLNAAGIPTDVIVSAKNLEIFLANKSIRSLLRRSAPLERGYMNSSDTDNIPEEYRCVDSNAINLRFLLESVMSEIQSLDWDSFNHNNQHQPLHIVTTCADSMSPIALSAKNGNFNDLLSLLRCIRASMLVPGVTGPLVYLPARNCSPTIPFSSDNSLNERDSMPSKALVKKYSAISYRYSIMARLKTKQFMSKSLKSLASTLDSFNAETARIKDTAQLYNSTNQNINSMMSTLKEWTRKQIFSNQLNHLSHSTKSDSDRKNSYSSLKSRKLPKSYKSIMTKSSKRAISSQYTNGSPKVAVTGGDDSHLCDAFLCEPIPYRSAVSDGATHVIALQSRPDSCKVLGKGPGVYELLIGRRFFQMYGYYNAINWLLDLQHHRVYAEDMLIFNEASLGPINGVSLANCTNVHILPIAPSKESTEVDTLELKRDSILHGMRSGARRVLELFLPAILAELEGGDIAVGRVVNYTTAINLALDTIFPLSLLDRSSYLEEAVSVVSNCKGFKLH